MTKLNSSNSAPSNQKAVYKAFAHLYSQVMNEGVSIEKAQTASRALCGMNQTYLLEIKRAQVEKKTKVRSLER